MARQSRLPDGARILLVDPSEKGAMPLYTTMVAEGLAHAGLRPAVLASRHFQAPEMDIVWPIHKWLRADPWPPPPGSPPVPAWRQAAIWLSCALTVLWAALWLRPHLVHFQHPIHPRLDPLLLRALGWIVPVVWTAHDILPHDSGKKVVERARRLYRLPRLVLAHSVPAADQLRRIAGIDAVVIQHPVRKLSFLPERASARTKLGLTLESRVAVAVGFIRAYKGYRLIAETWMCLGNEAPQLLILGELVDESERGTIEQLKAHPRVSVRLGYASDQDLINAVAAADVVLLPHERGSDSGSLHMARAIGVPVLASDTPQLAAVVSGTGAGWVLPRDPAVWAQALRGDLPPKPPEPPSPEAFGREHRSAYDVAWRR